MRRRAAIAIAVAATAGLAAAVWLWVRSGGLAGRPRSTTTLVVRITDAATGAPVAARVLLWACDGGAGASGRSSDRPGVCAGAIATEPLHIGTLDVYGARQGAAACPIAPGVIGSWNGLIVAPGIGEVPIGADACTPSPAIPYGRYHVWAWRGIEYERWEGDVDLAANRGRVELAIPLERAWTPHGTLAADLHVHARASSDSNVPNPQRVVAQVAAGIQVIGLSDHNISGDLDAEITALGLDPVVASIASNELSANRLHLGVYPVPVDRDAPRGGGPDPAKIENAGPADLFAIAHAFPGDPIVQVNHPRFRSTALFDGAGWNGVTWPPPFPLAFDAVEVLAGYSAANVPGDRRIDDSVRDYFTLTDHGHLIAPLGNSDTHDLNWVLDGTTRSYVFVDDPGVRPFDERGFVAAIRARRVVATSGPWLDVEVATAEGATPTVGPGEAIRAKGTVWVDVTVSRARFVVTEWIRITVGTPAGPTLVQTIDVPAGRSFHWAGAVPVGDVDTWLAVTADGDTALPLQQTGTYQHDKWKRPGVTPFALASPILIDADGDGRWKRGDADEVLP